MTDPSDFDKKPETGNGGSPPDGAMTQPVLPGSSEQQPALAAKPESAALPASPVQSALPVTEPASALPAGVPPTEPQPPEDQPEPADAPGDFDPTRNQPIEAADNPLEAEAAGDGFPEATGDSCDDAPVSQPPIDLSKAVVLGEAPDPTGVTPVVGVKFQRACKTYFFNSGTTEVKIGEHVIVETDRGLGLARVVTPVVELQSDKITAQLKRVIRKAHWNDLDRDRKNREREHEALKLCQERIVNHGLPMKLVRVEYMHDASKAVFFFTAESRVDFRELVKDLARQLHTRIEMRQIGVRDESKIIGGIGPCGREICCSTFLTDFIPVSVRMAKDQNLAMNPGKVSGLCGRLMCCLSYEHQLYQEQVKKMPKKGKTLRCNDGPCRVIDLNILGGKVLVELESGKTIFVPASELRPLDQLEPNPDAEPRDEPEPEKNARLDSDDPRSMEDAPRSKTEPRVGGRETRPRESQPRQEKPREDRPAGGRRDDRNGRPAGGSRDNRPRPPDRSRPVDRPAPPPGQGQDNAPAGDRPPPRSDRPAPPPSTTAYTGRQRPPGAAGPRPERPDARRDDRRDDRRDQREPRPGQRREPRPEQHREPRPEPPRTEQRDQQPPPARPDQSAPNPPGQTGQPGTTGDRPHHHRRRRKNH